MAKIRFIIAASLITATMTVTPLFARRNPDDPEHLQRIDADGDKQITELEWTVYQAERFKNLDANGNGVISEREIKKHIRSRDDEDSDDDDEEERDRKGPPGRDDS